MYIGTAINDSPVVAGVAGSAMEKGAMRAVKFGADGGLVPADAGSAALGLLAVDTEEAVAKGGGLSVQVKDIGYWATGAAFQAGALLACDAEGRAVPATAGAFILAQAMDEATAAGQAARVQIIKAGYAPAAPAQGG